MMIWAPERNRQQGLIVAGLYQPAAEVPCDRLAVIAGGLPGSDKPAALAAASVDPARFLTVSADAVLRALAAAGMIPVVAGLSPMEAADLAHTEAQSVAKRAALRGMADGRNLILDVSMASAHAVKPWLAALRSATYAVTGVFADLGIEESVRRTDSAHRRGEEEYRRGHGHGGRYIPAEAIRALAHDPAVDETSDQAPQRATTPDAWFPGREVTAMIGAWRAGQIALADLAGQFRSRNWPAVPSACPPAMQQARAAIDDLEPYIPGSFDDVALAYDLGQLTDANYSVLAHAAAT